jgi:hypothetical protein
MDYSGPRIAPGAGAALPQRRTIAAFINDFS